MGERSVSRNEFLLDPLFEIPEGVDEFVYDEDKTSATEQDISFSDGETIDGYYDTAASREGGLPVPEYIAIIEQVVRAVRGGSEVVDVIIDVEDLPGVTEYEFRVTKL